MPSDLTRTHSGRPSAHVRDSGCEPIGVHRFRVGHVLYMTGGGYRRRRNWSGCRVAAWSNRTIRAGTQIHFPALSPDGRELAVSVMEENTQLWLRRFDGSRQKLTPTGSSSNWRPSWSADGRTIRYSGIATGRALDMGHATSSSCQPTEEAARRDSHRRRARDLGGRDSRDGQWMLYRIVDVGGEGSDVRARRPGRIPARSDFREALAFSKSPSHPEVAGSPTGRRNRAGRRFG